MDLDPLFLFLNTQKDFFVNSELPEVPFSHFEYLASLLPGV